MKHLKTFERFNNTMIGSIFNSDYDKYINSLFKRIKDTFDINNLSLIDDGLGTLKYRIEETSSFNGFIDLEVRDDTFFAIPGYTLMIDNEKIDCSYLVSRKVYKFLKSEFDKIDKLKKINNLKSKIDEGMNHLKTFDDGDKWTFERFKIKDIYSLEVGKKYKITYPNYDDFDEGLARRG